ncbi:MAG: hypothetical protein ACXWK4_06195, partial [Myxococcaceae bacterium]
SYCDGFAVLDARGHTIAVDTYAYLGAKPTCRGRWTAGARVTSLSGIWQQHASLSVLALAGCDGLDGAEGQAAGAPPSTDDVHQLLAGWAPGLGVWVRGVVVARWKSGSGAFGFALQDPGGAPASGVRVVRSRTSPVPASAPEVGDGVRVTARTSRSGEHVLEL